MKKLFVILAIGLCAACNSTNTDKSAADSTTMTTDTTNKMTTDTSSMMQDTGNRMMSDTSKRSTDTVPRR